MAVTGSPASSLELPKIGIVRRQDEVGRTLLIRRTIRPESATIGLHRPIEVIESSILAETLRVDARRLGIGIGADDQRQAQVVRADADARAAGIYAQSFGKDASFYDFYRAMQSYRRTFNADGGEEKGSTTFLLSPNNSYLREFEGRER